MQSLGQARRKNASSGEPIHSPIQGLNKAEVFIRRGELSMIAGGPGSGKTAIAHAWIHHGDGRGNKNSALVFSADSSSAVIWKRSAALSTGYSQSDIDQMQARGETESLDAKIRAHGSHLEWDFTGTPSEQHVLNEVDAFAEKHGAYPEVILMDNLKDLEVVGVEDEFRALEEGLMFLKQLARDTGAAVIALHHISGVYEDGNMPVPLSGIRGKVTKTPATVLTIHRNGEYLNLSPVKQRGGKVDTSGRWCIPVRSDLAHMRFGG